MTVIDRPDTECLLGVRAATTMGDVTVKDEDLLGLVQRSATSMADLYRKAKKRGLLPARSQYQ